MRGNGAQIETHANGARPTAGRSLAVGAACGVAAFAIYAISAAPGVDWQDSAVHQYRIIAGELVHPVGLAMSHPLHYWLGRALIAVSPLNPTYTLNLFAGLCGAATVGLLAGLLTSVSRSWAAGMLGAATTALSFSFWQMSAMTETYTLASALMVAEWLLLLGYARGRGQWMLAAVFAVNGLHVANHLLGLLTLAVYGLLALQQLARRKLRAGVFVSGLLLWVVTASLYWGLVLEQAVRTGELSATLVSALFGGTSVKAHDGYIHLVLGVQVTWDFIKLNIWVLGYNFPSLALPVALLGLVRWPPGGERLFLTAMAAVTGVIAVFVLRYYIMDQYTFYVPLCTCIGFWFGLGAERLLRGAGGVRRRWALAALTLSPLMQVGTYATFPALAERFGFIRHLLRDVPFRNEYRHFFEPWKTGDDSPEQFVRAVLARLKPGDVFIGDGTIAYPLAAYIQANGGPEGIEIFSWTRSMARPELGSLAHGPMRDEIRRLMQQGRGVYSGPSEFVNLRFNDLRYDPQNPPIDEGFRVDKRSVVWRLYVEPPLARFLRPA